jgi:hypothetical protein
VTGLRPRPAVDPDVLAAIHQAIDHVVAQQRPPATVPAWRFSGRWFSAHPIRARSRPG